MQATLLFPTGTTKQLTTTEIVVRGLDVYELRNDLRGTAIGHYSGRIIHPDKATFDHTSDLKKRRTVSKLPSGLEGLWRGEGEWLAGGPGAVYISADEGETWRREALSTREQIDSVVRHDGALWAAGTGGLLAFHRDGQWLSVPRPAAPEFEKLTYGDAVSYPVVAIARLKIVGDSLYVLGQGLWRIDPATKTAELVVASSALLIDLAQTDAGTLIAVGVDGTVLRLAKKAKSWSAHVVGTDTHVGVVALPAGVLLVSTTSLALSSDDGESFGALEGPEIDRGEGRFHTAVADGHGGALVAGWRGLLVRVSADGLGPWASAKATKTSRTGAKASKSTTVYNAPREKDPTEEARLVADVIATPTDDAPRLVYADWLTEHGDARGEFIQLQCVLKRGLFGAKMRPELGHEPHPDHFELEKREQQLLKKHAKDWLAPVRKCFYQWQWKRGFLDYIAANAAFFDGASELLSRHPLECLELSGLKKNDYTRIATTDFGSLTWLNVQEQRLGPDEAQVLSGPNLSKIETLLLWNNEIGPKGTKHLANSHLTNLRELSLLDCRSGDEGIAAIASSPVFAKLEVLAIGDCGVTDDGVRALAASKTLVSLQHVDFGRRQPEGFSADALEALQARLVPGWNHRQWQPYTRST